MFEVYDLPKDLRKGVLTRAFKQIGVSAESALETIRIHKTSLINFKYDRYSEANTRSVQPVGLGHVLPGDNRTVDGLVESRQAASDESVQRGAGGAEQTSQLDSDYGGENR